MYQLQLLLLLHPLPLLPLCPPPSHPPPSWAILQLSILLYLESGVEAPSLPPSPVSLPPVSPPVSPPLMPLPGCMAQT